MEIDVIKIPGRNNPKEYWPYYLEQKRKRQKFKKESKNFTPDDFRGTHMTTYNKDMWKSRGYTSIEVLPVLIGKPWDEVALALVHSLRPSSIRVTTGLCKLDSRTWRVTVYIDEKDESTITRISQEVEVGLPEGVAHGAALDLAIAYGIDDPRVKWYDTSNDTEELYCKGYCYGLGGERKLMSDGSSIPFPNIEDEK